MATFNFIPDVGAQKTIKPNVKVIKFGDGYEQRQTFGMNVLPQTWSLTFANRDQTESDAIEAFFVALEGNQSFDWTPPGASSALKFKITEWSKTVQKGNFYSISVVFEQLFEP